MQGNGCEYENRLAENSTFRVLSNKNLQSRNKHTSCSSEKIIEEIHREATVTEAESAVSFTSRSHTCGSLRSEDIDKHVRLCGWIQSVHYNGKFLQLRDWDGWVQLVITDDKTNMLETIRSLSLESVIEVAGTVKHREQINENVPTGLVEVFVDSLHILNTVDDDLPFVQKDLNFHKVNEQLQMEYRYLALRYKTLQHNLRQRSKIIMKLREFLANKHNFIDVETPTLFRRTPGGAKEFVVPTHHPGKFYCLPQSPQQFKQLLMVGGIDRYFQVAKCYRDEGSRPDRQPEFTQLDIEMSFVTREGIIKLIEELLVSCWPDNKPPLEIPFPTMTYQQAMRLYGTDKPDTRFDMKISSLKDKNDSGPQILRIKFHDKTRHISKSKLNSHLKSLHYKPKVKWHLHRYSNDDSNSDDFYKRIKSEMNFGTDDVVISTEGEEKECKFVWVKKLTGLLPQGVMLPGKVLEEKDRRLLVLVIMLKKVGSEEDNSVDGARSEEPNIDFAKDFDDALGELVRDSYKFNFLWVLDFPLFLPKEEGEGLESAHHPFTDVHPEDAHLFYTHPEKVRGQHYDLVLNGNEVGGGSIRIHNPDKQKYVIEHVLKEDVHELSHLLKAFTMGCPPHGGIALGLDRLLACILGTNSIRDVIAFPKSTAGRDLMSDAPAEISTKELDRYHISVVKDKS